MQLCYRNPESLLKQVYSDLPKGYRISDEDRASIDREGKGAVYGEMPFSSFEKILKEVALNEEDTFIDFGSGIGKLVLQAALTTPVKKSIGIEASKERHEIAVKALQKIEKAPAHKKIEFIHGNFLDHNIEEVTFAFLCSTCYSEKVLSELERRLFKAPKLRVVATLSKFPLHKGKETLELFKEKEYPSSWTDETRLFYYRRSE